MIAMPDPSTFTILPWRPEEQGRPGGCSATCRCPAASPTRATRAGSCAGAARADALDGLRPVLHRARSSSTSTSARRTPASGPPEVLDKGGYFDLTTLDAGSDLRRETVLALEQLGIHVEYSHHEVGPSQHEVDMRFADALKMADDCMTYRITVKEYAMKYGFYATFMPKPLFGENGSGMHVHQSLFKGERNAFYDAERPVLPVRRREVVHRGPAEARARDRGAVRAVGELLQAARARLRGAGLRRLVAPQPLGADPGAALPPRQGAGDALRDPQPGPVLQPVPVLRGLAAGGPRGDREGLRAARADGAQPLPPVAGRAQAARASSSCRRRSARRSRSRRSRS